MGLYFGSFAAILIGTEAGTIDLAAACSATWPPPAAPAPRCS